MFMLFVEFPQRMKDMDIPFGVRKMEKRFVLHEVDCDVSCRCLEYSELSDQGPKLNGVVATSLM